MAMAKSDKQLIEGIEQRGEPVPAGYSYDPRRTPKLVRLDSPVVKRQPNDHRGKDEEEE